MRMHSFSAASALVAIASSLPGQTIVVSGGGAALQQAINTAPPGATLDVMPGTYSPVVATQALHISLRAGAIVGQPPPPVQPPAFAISALPAGQQFVLEGSGKVWGLQFTGCAGDILVNGINHGTFGTTTISSCSAAVIFHRTSCVTASSSTSHGSIAIINCSHVSFTACQLSALTISSSRVSLSHSSNLYSYGSAPGIDLQSGSVVVDGGTIEGAAQFSFPIPHPGVRIGAGELIATGGAVIRYSSLYPLPYIAIESTGGVIRLDPSVQLIGTTTGPATVLYGEIPSLDVSHTASAMTVALTGEPGSAVFTLAGPLMSPVPTPWGDAWLSPLDVIVDVVVLPASGAHTFSVPVANPPPFATLVVQSVALTATSLNIGAPARFAWD